MKTNIIKLEKYACILLCSLMLLFSCSKDRGFRLDKDTGEEPADKTQLILTASATEIDKGGTVTFEVTTEGKTIDAEIYIDNTKISDTTYTFDEVGTYKAVAKKDGYLDSKEVQITVQEKPYEVDVYVAGSEIINNIVVAKYWKNGKSIDLPYDEYRSTRAILYL